ncbi:hypothetical protein niasHT_027343 [Heterodera trifolii]|uniref:Uncharacterized protein n=1 Tax=Heterodera trifolii TaxID=157864 RepID=A0ABD2JU05_9BILA
MANFVPLFFAVSFFAFGRSSALPATKMTTTTTERPIIYDPKEMVEIAVKLESNAGAKRNFSVEITNYVFFLVCDLKIKVELPKTATLESVANLKPVKGTADQFTFPASINFLYVSKTHKAKLTVKGDGEPKVTVLDAKAAHSPKKCKISKF